MSVFFYKARNKWACNYSENGKVKRKIFETEQEAISFNNGIKQSHIKPDRYTLGEIIILFFKSKEDYHPHTKKNIIYFFAGYEKGEKHIEGAGEFLRDKYADSISRKDLAQMRINIKNKSNSSNATCNKYQAYIRAILQWAVEQDYILLNPWRDLKRLPVKRKVFKTTLQDFQTIIACADEWLQWAFYTAYACSLRFGMVELFSLKWSAFNWKRGCVQLCQGKSGAIKTVYPPQEYMQEAFRRYTEDYKKSIIFVCHNKGRKIFSYRQAWLRALKNSGYKNSGIRPYDIRHIAASEMLANGADLAAVSAQLGHSSVITTGTFYAHVTAGAQQKASSLLPNIMKKETN